MAYEGPIHWSTNRPAWYLWLWWVAATVLPGVLALALSDAIVLGGPEYQFNGDNGLLPLLGWSCGIWLIGGALIGGAQGLCLSRGALLIPSAETWAFLTIAGILLAMLLNLVANVSLFIGAGAYLVGFGVGAAQCLGLRFHGLRAALWFLGSGVAWIAAFRSGSAVSNLFLTKDPKYGLPYYTFQSALFWGLAAFVGLLVYGALTGLVLVWFVKTPVLSNK